MRLPDFVCVGAMRCGTTTLWNELRRHPDVFMPDRKELHFFDYDPDYEKGTQFYTHYFSTASSSSVCGEITPSYMFRREWRRRLHQLLPDARIIVILRDPVQRAWSHYKFSSRWGPEGMSFRKAIAAEPIRVARDRNALIYFSYRERGIYVDQIEHLVELYGRDRVLVIFMEELMSERMHTLEAVRRHLNLPTSFSAEPAERQNEIATFPRSRRTHLVTREILSGTRTSALHHRAARQLLGTVHRLNLKQRAPSLPKDIAENLRKFYTPHDQRLSDFLGRKLPWDELNV